MCAQTVLPVQRIWFQEYDITILLGFSYVDLVNREGHNYALVSEMVFSVVLCVHTICCLPEEVGSYVGREVAISAEFPWAFPKIHSNASRIEKDL